jgi:hypothetical protein
MELRCQKFPCPPFPCQFRLTQSAELRGTCCWTGVAGTDFNDGWMIDRRPVIRVLTHRSGTGGVTRDSARAPRAAATRAGTRGRTAR